MTGLTASERVRTWLAEVRDWSQLKLEPVPFSKCTDWRYQGGRLVHDAGRFFSVAGVRVEGAPEAPHGSDLPMIDQPEIGWLSFIIRPGPDGIEWLVQAKTEPGNLGETQLAPSVQATRSNYMQVHGGRPTRFLDLLRHSETFVSDAPHSEQGTRFLWKFNRNSVLAVSRQESPDVSGLRQWAWCSSAALRDMLADDFRVNTDARSVIATAPWALLSEGGPLFSAPVLAQSYRSRVANEIGQLALRTAPFGQRHLARWQPVPLDGLAGWTMTDRALCDGEGRDAVACFEISVNGREVDHWCQPFLMQPDPADHVLFMRVTGTGAEFFVRIYQEAGFGARRELGPSLHSAFATPEDLQSWAAAAGASELIALKQSDEGGRFMHAEGAYRIVRVQGAPKQKVNPAGQWVTLAALERLAARPGGTTNELRTLISLILSTEFDRACSVL